MAPRAGVLPYLHAAQPGVIVVRNVRIGETFDQDQTEIATAVQDTGGAGALEELDAAGVVAAHVAEAGQVELGEVRTGRAALVLALAHSLEDCERTAEIVRGSASAETQALAHFGTGGIVAGAASSVELGEVALLGRLDDFLGASAGLGSGWRVSRLRSFGSERSLGCLRRRRFG
jgi:hypothetical protein